MILYTNLKEVRSPLITQFQFSTWSFSQLLRYQNTHLTLLNSIFGASYLKKIPALKFQNELLEVSVSVNGTEYLSVPVLKLTSNKLISKINSNSSNKEMQDFLHKYGFTKKQKETIKKLFLEAKENAFIVNIENPT